MNDRDILNEIWAVIDDRFDHPKEGSYISQLIADEKGIDRVLEKVGEESTEFVIAVKNGRPDRIQSEAADLLFHLLVALRASGVDIKDLMEELKRRRGIAYPKK
jgi:phosphoribosyl-ATP pyrophosphohydrolase